MSSQKYKRWQYHNILNTLKTRRVIILAGARQTGKTTLVKQLTEERCLGNKNLNKTASNNIIYRSLDDVTLLEAALSDPHGFVAHDEHLMIIDEVQRAPILLQAIKQNVDINTGKGRFLLTGSANIRSLPNVKESLAGRVSKIPLHPLSQGEILFRSPTFINLAFSEKFLVNEYLDKDAYLLLAFRGGYPEILDFEQNEIRRWHKDYIEALIEHDLNDIANIRRKDSMYKLMGILSAWSSKFMDISAIGTHLALTRSTLESYINALETLFLVKRVPPWSKTDYDRVSKHDKLFLADSGLMTSMLDWRFKNIRLNGEKNGKLIETFVFNQLLAILDTQTTEFSLYHYRDREKREIDFIIENALGDILGIEIKAGSSIGKEDFKHLIWFKNKMARNNHFIGVILYTGEHIASFGNQLWAVPISSLWATE